IHIPLGYTRTFTDPRVNWMFDSEPEQQLNGRILYQPRGKVLGGTSSINGMVYMRGTSTDYDGWRQKGCEGWGYDDVLPFFKKAEDQQRGPDEFHGEGGPAVGVEYRTPQGTQTAFAKGEIVVSGGVYGSPQLLQLSGLGPGELLQQFGIPVVRDMEGVGKHLHDHFNTYLVWRCSQKVTLNDLAASPMRKLVQGAQYVFTRSGQLSNAGIYAGALVRS